MSKEKIRIDWSFFEGSSHCEEGVAEFATGGLKTFKDWSKWHLPHMKEQADYVKFLSKHLSLFVARRRAAAKARQWFQSLK